MRYIKLLLVLFVALTAAGEQPLRMRAQEANNPRFGLVDAYEAPVFAEESGAGWELVTLRWADLQPDGPDQWQPDPTIDEWLDATRAQGREVVVVLTETPAWAAEGDVITGAPAGLFLPVAESGNLWAGFVRQAVNYYSARGVDRYVIWDQQDIPTNRANATWSGSIEEYYQLVKVAYQVANDANPNAQIHLGGATYTDPGWFSRFMQEVIDDPTAAANNYYFDVATIHVFGSPEDVYIRTGNHYGVMAQSGIAAKPVWINQLNARPTEDTVYGGDELFSPFPNITLDQQRSFIIQAYALGFAAGADRIAVYQLEDDLTADDGEAYGLVRADGTIRPAYEGYQLAADLFSNSVFERRVDEEAFPLIDYVRFTSPTRVIHVAWGRTAEPTATLTIPARTQQATLIRIDGQSWTVEPESGVYNVVVEGATCNDPVYSCLIGGRPWILVEEGVEDAVDSPAPPITVTEGGALQTPPDQTDPTPTPEVEPTPTSEAAAAEDATNTIEASPTPLPEPTEALATAVAEVSEVEEDTADDKLADAFVLAEIEQDLQPRGFMRALPFLLGGLGVVTILGGMAYFVSSAPPRQRDEPDEAEEDVHIPAVEETREHEAIADEEPEANEDDEGITSREETREHERPKFRTATGILIPKPRKSDDEDAASEEPLEEVDNFDGQDFVDEEGEGEDLD